MISVRELMTDRDFATRYTVVRSKGKWVKGRFEAGPAEKLKYCGPVQPATPKELEQFPEGDRNKEIMKFMCKPPKKIYTTDTLQGDGEADGRLSDKIIWDGQIYKIIRVQNWRHHGYTRAFGVCIGEVEDG